MIWNKEKIITFSFASRNVFFEKPDRFVNYTTNTVEKDLDLFVYRKTTIDVERYSYSGCFQSGKKSILFLQK